jgi:hypothetical protein
MWLMARLARRAAGMVLGVHLRKLCRLGQVRLMASRAKGRRVGQLGNHVCGIKRVLALGSVAGLAIDRGVFPRALNFDNVAVAFFARFVARVVDWTGRNFREGITAEVPVLTEAVGYQHRSKEHKERQSGNEHPSQPEEVLGVLESVHRQSPCIGRCVKGPLERK